MLEIGVIGLGKMGKIRASVAAQSGRARVLGVYEPSDIETDEYPRAASAEMLLHNPAIDAIFVCTPNCRNKQFTIEALRAGKHVFCEKPPAFSASEVEEIRTVETRSGKKLMYGLNHRHHSSIRHMKRLLDSREFGEVLWMRGRYGKSVESSYAETWRANRSQAGGGILIDQGIHMVDLFLHIGGPFDHVQSVVSNRFWQGDTEDNVFAMLTNTKTGVVASLHSTMTQWRHLFSLEVFLERGYMVLNGLKTSSRSYGDEILCIAKNRSTAPAATFDDEERITFHTDVSWRSEFDHFVDAIEHQRPITTGSSLDALILMKTIDAIYQHGTITTPNLDTSL